MTRAILATALATTLFTLAPCEPAHALDYPTQYIGSYRVTVTVKNPWGSGLCANDAALTITLQADGQLRYEPAGLETFITSETGSPASCEIRPNGKTVLVMGTHDGQGNFSVPSGSASFPPMTGHYDADHISAEYAVGPSHIAFDLPSVNHSITIEPDPSQGFDFHLSLLEGKGFKLVMHDPQGRDHLDYATLKVLVAGNDTTAHFNQRLLQGNVPVVDESPDSRTRVLRLKLDPKLLMTAHDIFAIPYNGDVRIELQMCDKAQTCFSKAYTVYFGPFVSSGLLPTDGRCGTPPDPFMQVSSVVAGNIGMPSPNTAIFMGLANPGLTDLWTYFMADFGDGFARQAWWQGLVQAFLPKYDMPTGYLLKMAQLPVPMWLTVPAGPGTPYERKLPFSGGTYKFITAAMDSDTGAYRMDTHLMVTCDK